MLWPILGTIAGIIVLFLLYVASKPNDFRVERSATMAAPPATVFAQVNDFHNWQAWSPWAKLDPNMSQTYEGPEAGRGAVYSWNGNNKVGAGRMAITESRPNEYIKILLEFLRPFKSTNNAEFTFRPSGNQTDVNWTMTGQHNFMSKLFCSFMSMDKMVGKDFEKGLSQMKAVVESPK
jgi:carbon monoxide dehydrogenase subunit G